MNKFPQWLSKIQADHDSCCTAAANTLSVSWLADILEKGLRGRFLPTFFGVSLNIRISKACLPVRNRLTSSSLTAETILMPDPKRMHSFLCAENVEQGIPET